MIRIRSLLIPGSFLAIGLLAACATSTPPRTAAEQRDSVRASDAAVPGEKDTVGRIGPDGGPLLADRGIGGTGAPNSAALQVAERGIGGTGIVGVVTGFGSVFVDGIEVRYDDTAPVDIDGTASSTAALRVGQMVAIQADGPAASPYARAISVRTAVSGRIEALELGTGMLTIGGQSVLVPDGTWGANSFGLGDWVKVSGLRRADGTIVASRLDTGTVGVLTARGKVERDGDVVRVGNLVLPAPMAAAVKDGQFVVVSGDYAAGHGHVGTIAPDTMLPNPADYFGKAASRLIIQAFVQVDKGSLSMNGMKVNAGAIASGQARHDGIAVISMERGADGSYSAVDFHYAGYHGQTDRPFHRGAAARTSDASAMARNARANLAMSSQPDAANNGSTTGGHLAASIASDLDSLTGSPGSSISTVGTPSAIVSDPIITPGTPDPSTLPGIKSLDSNPKTTPSQLSTPISSLTPPLATPPSAVSATTTGGASISSAIIPPTPTPPAAPTPPTTSAVPPSGTAKPEGGLGQVGTTGSGQASTGTSGQAGDSGSGQGGSSTSGQISSGGLGTVNGSGSGQLISGTTTGGGTIQSAARREHHWASRNAHETPSAVTLRGANWGSTVNEITTAVTTSTTATPGGRAGGTSTANTSFPAAASKPATTIGTTSGRSFGSGTGKRQGH